MRNTKIQPFVDSLEAVLAKIEFFYTKKKGKVEDDTDKIHFEDLGWMIGNIKNEIYRVKMIDDQMAETLNDELYYETEYLDDLEQEGILTFMFALMQAKNVLRSARDITYKAGKL